MRTPIGLVMVVALAAACSSTPERAVETTPTTVAVFPSEVCRTLGGLPLPLRRPAMEAAGEMADVVAAMEDECPRVLRELEALEAIVEDSASLDQSQLVLDHTTEVSCGELGIGIGFINPFDVPVRLVLAGGFIDDLDATVTAGASVTAPIEPGSSQRLLLALDVPPTAAGCWIDAQPFLFDVDERSTDTWDPALGLAPGPPLPDTTGSDWQAILSAIVEQELTIADEGDWVASGGFEDVRSKNYASLTAQTEPDPGSGVIPAICSVDTVDDGVTLVLYEYTGEGVERAVAAGVFRRSPLDGRWRWLMTSMILDVSGRGCEVLEGGLVA